MLVQMQQQQNNVFELEKLDRLVESAHIHNYENTRTALKLESGLQCYRHVNYVLSTNGQIMKMQPHK